VRTDKLAAEHGVESVYIHFPLHPETPPEGRDLKDLFAGRERELQGMKERLQKMFAAEGLPWGERNRTFNSRLAQELACWAVTLPSGEGIHDALFRAYFVDSQNLADPETLVRLAGGIGLPTEEARVVLHERRFKEAVDRDWQRSYRLGIRGVPAYSFGEQILVGAQPYEVLEDLFKVCLESKNRRLRKST
jgi:predicted DsbA family dithiol-disulfide isomerase